MPFFGSIKASSEPRPKLQLLVDAKKNRRVSTPSFRNRASAHERIHIRHFIESSSRGTASLASPAA